MRGFYREICGSALGLTERQTETQAISESHT